MKWRIEMDEIDKMKLFSTLSILDIPNNPYI